MFKEARIKLTAWYLVIIMAISLSFSVAIYMGINRELIRIGNMQAVRQQRVDTISNFLMQNGLPIPPEIQSVESETVEAARLRIISALGLINLSILVIAGLGGYFLAGQTLDPISKMVREQKEFVSNASHELRTPLTSLKTEIEVGLRNRKLGVNEVRELLKSNLEDVNGMQKLSNYLLELSRYENSENKLEIKKVDLGKIAKASLEKLQTIAATKGISILDKTTHVYVHGNEDALSQLTTILIENAVKYSGKAKKVEVYTKKNGLLIVKDFGVGIFPADIPHIFERFYRADTSRSKNKSDGYGLGLSIAKSIVDKLGGKIKVASTIGKGSTFSVQIPLA